VGGDDKPSGERKYIISLAESSTNLLLVEMVIQLRQGMHLLKKWYSSKYRRLLQNVIERYYLFVKINCR
jgi:hypothetical protein